MKKTTILIALLALCFSAQIAVSEVTVSNVEAVQQDHPSKFFEITYDVESDSATVFITLHISSDGGETWNVRVRTVEGDIGDGVEPGEDKQIIWDGGTDYPDQINDQMRAKVTAYDDRGGEPEAGDEREFELADGTNITMVWIPSGSFEMGSPDDEDDREGDEGPVHDVTFEDGFWMGKYEVTQSQWAEIMDNNPAHDYGVGDDHPVYYVSWNDIQGFEERLEEGFRLPSEAEWEYACRAGSETRFYWGDDNNYNEIGDYAVYRDNDPNGTAEVGTKRPNAWGLHDMSGNVYEWCEDWYHGNYNGAPDNGDSWVDDGSYRVLRGGSWSRNPSRCRSAYRIGDYPGNGHGYVGFRLVLVR